MRTITLPNSFFSETAEQLKHGKTVRISVIGESMYPFLHSGDTITLEPYRGEDLPLFTGVFYEWQGHYMTHRLIKKEGNVWHMLGDGNIYRIESVAKSNILGVLTNCTRPNGKVIDCTTEEWRNRGKLWTKLRRVRRVLYKPLRWMGI